MLCGLFTAIYQLFLFLFYFFYFLFKGKPEWQKNGERRCATGTAPPVCCLHSPLTTNEETTKSSSEAVSKPNSTTTNETLERNQTDACPGNKSTTTLQPPNESISSGLTQNDISQPYKTTSHFKGTSEYSHVAKQQSKFTACVSKISESVKHLIMVPYNYLVNALVYTKDGIYSFARGARNLLLSKRPSLQSNEQFVEKSFEDEQESLAEHVTKAFEKHDATADLHDDIHYVPIFKTVAPFSYSTEVTDEKQQTIAQPLKGPAEFYARTEALRDISDSGANADAKSDSLTTSPPPPPPPPFGVLPTNSGAQPNSTTQTLEKRNAEIDKARTIQKPKGAVAVLPPDLMAEASARIRELETKLNEAEKEQRKLTSTPPTNATDSESALPQNENVDTSASDWAVSNRRFLPQWTEATTLTHRRHASRGYGTTDSEDETDLSWRPYGRKVVSRISTANDENSQFIFSQAKSPEYIMQSSLPDGGFFMGRSVFSPLPEAEEMRPSINRRASATPSESRVGSRINTPFEELLSQPRINTPLESTPYDYSRPQSRRWPPASNATGVEFTKDNWNVIPSTVTSCRSKLRSLITIYA
ncbi:unnamed protein product [Toxocara canis]|uniref:WASH_WAHD domain-containing protein n=1 Tax=Toxocara canis TaxID=6265 RepID=A0A183UEH1_TOXCA|nr:unnamed protein product [Toxocara canis]